MLQDVITEPDASLSVIALVDVNALPLRGPSGFGRVGD